MPHCRGLTRVALTTVLAALLVGCAGGTSPRHPVKPPPSSAPSVATTTQPTRPPLRAKSPTSPDTLGARRVITVPTAIAQKQLHRLMAVDDEAVLLDAESDARPRPLLVVLHGLGEDAGEMRRQTGFTALAALTGFDVVYPDAPQDPAAQPTTATLSVVIHDAVGAATASPSVSPAIPPPVSSVTPTPPSSPAPTPRRSPSSTRTVAPMPARTIPVAPTTSVPHPTPASVAPSESKRPAPAPAPPEKKGRPSPLKAGTRAWNAGSCCAVPTRNDVGYLVDVVHAVEGSVPVDPSRVYIVGFSNGGMMALDAICSAPSVFAAAGSVSGPFLGTSCARPIWRHIAAAPDEVVPTAGGIPPGVPALGVVSDWCGCSFPATTTEAARFGFFASVLISPTGNHSWPTPGGSGWSFDPERDLWNYVSKFHF